MASDTWTIPHLAADVYVHDDNSGYATGNPTTTDSGGVASVRYSSGYRWSGVNVPQGSFINSAYMRVYVLTGGNEAYLTMVGYDADDAGNFHSGDTPIDRYGNRTSASEVWHNQMYIPAPGLWKNTPDFTSIAQEIIDRPGYAESGFCVIFKAYSVVLPKWHGRLHINQGAADLHIDWTPPSTGHRRRLVGVAGRSANKMGLMA